MQLWVNQLCQMGVWPSSTNRIPTSSDGIVKLTLTNLIQLLPQYVVTKYTFLNDNEGTGRVGYF